MKAFDCWPATPHAANEDRAINKLFKKLGKKVDDVEREALTAMLSALDTSLNSIIPMSLILAHTPR